jgi:glycosyltransferase involved in cell wall biosynthesis
MRIIHFILGRCNPESANGVDRAVYLLSRSQAEAGHDVFLFSLTRKECIPVDGVEVRGFVPRLNPFALPRILTTAIEQVGPAIVHLHSVFIPQYIALAGWLRRRGIPYAISPHGGLAPAVLQKRGLQKAAFNRILARSFWKEAVFVHALSAVEVGHLERYGIKQPIVVAPNGLDPSQIPDLATLDNSYLGRLYPETKGKRVFLFLGRLDGQTKGLDLLLEAYAGARESLQQAVLVLVGPDWRGSRRKLERRVHELRLGDRVIFAGPRYGMDKFHMLAGCDVFVHPSRSEGLPFAVLEAFALQKPCLITETAGFGEFFRRCPAGLRIKPSVKALAEALRYFASLQRDDLRKMGLPARQAVLQEFCWERTVETLVTAYQTYGKRCEFRALPSERFEMS